MSASSTKLPPGFVSLNKEFQIFRTNAIQRRRFRRDQANEDEFTSDDRVGLLRDEEMGNGGPATPSAGPTPSFVGQSEALEYQMTRLEDKLGKLEESYKASMGRPNLDDSDGEEQLIERLAREVTEAISQCHHQVKNIQKGTRRTGGLPGLMAGNVVSSLSARLQEVTERFRKEQGDYLKYVRTREEKSSRYFADDDDGDAAGGGDPFESIELSNSSNGRINTQELLLLEDNSKFVRQREKEINVIVKSIVELNTVFKDLAHMVTEQGSIVDRIDHNVETAHIRVEDGLQQLKKAERHQRKNLKMRCILGLAATLIFLVLVLFAKLAAS